MELTSNQCMIHADREHPSYRVNAVYKMMIDGEEVCPVCELGKETEKLERLASEQKDNAEAKAKYNTLSKASILTDKSLYTASFGNFITKIPEEVENRNTAIKAFEQYLQGETFNVCFQGDTGVGKSHLAMAILRNLNEKGNKDRSCLFMNVDAMLRKIRNSFGDKESRYTESYFVDLLSSVDFLVLDDIGAETGAINSDKPASDFTIKILRAVADARQEKPTIMTTNLTRQELVDMYDNRVVSRLLRDVVVIEFIETMDKRIKKKTL